MVAVDQSALLVDDGDTVGVAIERDADIGAIFVHGFLQRARIGGADFLVDVEAVGLDADRDHLRAQFVERHRRYLVGRAVGRIDDDAQALERKPFRERRLDDFDIARLRIVDAAGAAEFVGRGQVRVERRVHQLLDFDFLGVGEFIAVGAEQFDAVVGEFVVRWPRA